MEIDQEYSVNLEIPFPSARLAEIAYEVLRVDTEPKRSGVKKQLSHKENILHVQLGGQLAKQLRVAVNGFFDNLVLITQTVDFAGPPVNDSYSHYIETDNCNENA